MVSLPAFDETRQPRIVEKGKARPLEVKHDSQNLCKTLGRRGWNRGGVLRSAQHVIVHWQTTLSSDNTPMTSNPQATVKL
jgi:hypothetical protein